MDDETARQAKASIKEAIGMLIGNRQIKAEGAAEKTNAPASKDGKSDLKDL